MTAVVSPAVLPVPALAPWLATRPRRVGWAVGAALVGQTRTLRGLGPFDETIFMYGEDMDLGLRATRAGVETWFWPSARVLHYGRARRRGGVRRRAVRAAGPGAP